MYQQIILRQITVDSDFNEERDLIEIGNGTINMYGNDELCDGMGLPCLS